ncbi:hypothetical protein BDY24DRAFT_398395 [Mrakia frigida]|uniref:uncharacterized protein n=1 Tax=Mrakia frigida TaxID=29902 RepID=UPI003FCBF951
MPFGLPSQRKKDLDSVASRSPPKPARSSPPKLPARASKEEGRRRAEEVNEDGPTKEEEEIADEIEIGTLSSDPANTDWSTYKLSGSGLASLAKLSPDGRIVIDLNLKKHLPDLPADYAQEVYEPAVEKERGEKKGGDKWGGVPKLNVLLMIVGSRGDVQPYIALALRLVAHGHRVRLGTHKEFASFVKDCSKGKVEFFDIGGDPKDLMKFMVDNPGLMPGIESLTNGDIPKKKKMISEIMNGCYKASFSPDPETGRSFAADALIANPPSFAHIHLAEALGLPLQLSFTMPWSPTTEFNHPLVQINSSNAPKGLTNYLSFALADQMTWQGLSGITNSFRATTLGLAPLSLRSGPSVLDRLKIPWTYCWSGSLIPKPDDWKNNTDISGFYFLDLATGYEPPADLAAFLEAGPPPIYIGFGSVPVKDPKGMSQTIFDAVKASGVRALVSAGWGGLGGASIPDNVFILGNVPHDWLFTKVSAVCHHGGAGTTAIGLLNGRPTIVVPFFGDQQFWGDMVAKAGGGPAPIHSKTLNSSNLAEAINFVMTESAQKAARKMGEQIRAEDGVEAGVDSFHRHLPLKNMRCELDPNRVAVWWSDDLCLRLSGFAAQTLADSKKLNLKSLEPHRPKEYDSRKQATDPITGGASAILSTVTNYYVGIGTIFINPPKGIINTATAIPKGVLNIIGSIHEGFANLPKAYGSQVRKAGKVTDFSSGVKEGAKGFFYGYYDGITGLLREPIEGGQKDGLLGAIKGAGRSFINVNMRPAAGAIGLVAHPADGAFKSIQSLWARKEVSLSLSTRLEDGQLAFDQSTSSERRALLATFAEVDKHTEERKKALEEKAKLILEGKVKKAEGDEEEEGESGRTPGLTLTDEEGSEEESEGEKTPKDGKVKMERKKELSEGEVKLLRQLAMAEKKGYERGRAEQEAAKERV